MADDTESRDSILKEYGLNETGSFLFFIFFPLTSHPHPLSLACEIFLSFSHLSRARRSFISFSPLSLTLLPFSRTQDVFFFFPFSHPLTSLARRTEQDNS